MSHQQNNHQNNKRNKNHKNKQNGQRNQHTNNKEQKNKKVPIRYQIQNSKNTNTEEFKFDSDGTTEIMTLSAFEDRNEEEYLKLIKFTKFGQMTPTLLAPFIGISEG